MTFQNFPKSFRSLESIGSPYWANVWCHRFTSPQNRCNFFCVLQVADTLCSPLFNWKMQKNRSFLHTNILPTLQTVKPFEIIFWIKKKKKRKKKNCHFSGGEFKPLDSKYLLLNLYLLRSDYTILCSVSQQS